MYTKKEVMAAASVYDDLQIRLKEVGEEYFKIKYGHPIDELYGVSIENKICTAEGVTYSRCGCCSDDHEEFDFPLSYLWDADWERDLERQMMDDNLAAIKKKKLKDEADAKLKEEDEKAYYLKLKERWGGMDE